MEILERLCANSVVTDNGCWLFMAAPNTKLTGHRTIRRHGKKTLVHRLSWELLKGEIPGGKDVLHRCQSDGQCWNPDHLYIGGHFENAMDVTAQGGWNDRRGELNNNRKLTEQEVREIRGNTCGFTMPQIAEMYGTSTSNLRKIRRGDLWSHVS
jgi:hypothetical protein